jgi:hypothetical protein
MASPDPSTSDAANGGRGSCDAFRLLIAPFYEISLITNIFRDYLNGLGTAGNIASWVLPSSQSAYDAAQHNAQCAKGKQDRERVCGF